MSLSGPINPRKGEKAQQAQASAARGSWWTKYAVGEREDAAFMAEADKLVPKQEAPLLKIWTDEVA